MKIFPIDLPRFFLAVGIAFVFEIMRILMSMILAGERGVLALTEQRLTVLADLACIQSTQKQFVQKTKLERAKISIEKAIDKVKEDYQIAAPKWKRLFRALRFIVYAAAMLYLSRDPLIMLDSVMFWPLGAFNSTCSVVLSAWAVIPMAGFAFRHLFRAVLPTLTTQQVP